MQTIFSFHVMCETCCELKLKKQKKQKKRRTLQARDPSSTSGFGHVTSAAGSRSAPSGPAGKQTEPDLKRFHL